MARRRRHWGWGYEDEAPSIDDVRAHGPLIAEHLGFAALEVEEAAALGALPAPRIELAGGDAGDHARASHALGKSYVDVVRGMRGEWPSLPDAVLHPADEAGVVAALEDAAREGAVVVPYGGGTSVVGGVSYAGDRPWVSLDLGALDRVLEVDALSRAARVQAGAAGPVLDSQLAEHGLTARFYPQSFTLATVGGWIATRAGGHFATGPTHIDDLVESVRAVTPTGLWASRRLPGSGAGPSPDRMLLGSEGTLGVITEAWLRVQPPPVHRASRTVRFAEWDAGVEAVRLLAQSGLMPANCRLVDAEEARFTGAGDGLAHLLLLGFESTAFPVDDRLSQGLELAVVAGGMPDAPRERGTGSDGAWRETFLRAPYLRDTLAQLGVISETFETAITWDALGNLHASVTAAARDALSDERAKVTCRFTHAYSDGAAPYFTVLAPACRGEELEQWGAVKRAVSDALLSAGGTITHHHAVGRDHRPWYDDQRPDPFAAALRGAKAAVDPDGLLNPGVLLPEEPGR